MRRRKLSVVLMSSNALKNSGRLIYHEYSKAGHVRCGKEFTILYHGTRSEPRMNWVHRTHAEKIAHPCKSCKAA